LQDLLLLSPTVVHGIASTTPDLTSFFSLNRYQARLGSFAIRAEAILIFFVSNEQVHVTVTLLDDLQTIVLPKPCPASCSISLLHVCQHTHLSTKLTK